VHDGAVSSWHNPTTSVAGAHSPATSTGHDITTSREHDPSISAVYPAGPDIVIEADGAITTGDGLPAYQEVGIGDGFNLTKFESTFSGDRTEDILMFDVDNDKKWSTGDALVLESGTIDGLYDEATDTVLLVGNSNLSDGDAADFQLFVVGRLLGILFHDDDPNGQWAAGEDIVLDVNHNQVYNP